MLRFAEAFPDQRIVRTLSEQLAWCHFLELLPFDDSLKRDFYAEMCRLERWSVRTLRAKIGNMLFLERTAIAKRSEEVTSAGSCRGLRDEDRLTPDLVFRDPYVLDFLQLHDSFYEADVEQAILRDLEAFLLELGNDFSFVARQKRITVDAQDYYLDLLFYHRGLRRLVAMELKLDKFQAADKGQMELYLRWLDRHDRRTGEEAPIGLILPAPAASAEARRAAGAGSPAASAWPAAGAQEGRHGHPATEHSVEGSGAKSGTTFGSPAPDSILSWFLFIEPTPSPVRPGCR